MLNTVQMSLLMVFHPLDSLDIIKRERAKFHPLRVLALLLLTAAVNYTYIFYVNYALSTKQPADANIFLELAIVFVPILTWVVAAYATTAVVTGECSFTELLTGCSYCLVPLIITTPIFGLLSRILTAEEAGIYTGLQTLVMIWVGILLFLTLKKLNDYSFFKTVGVALLSILAMAIIWAVLILIFALISQLVYYLRDFLQEAQLKWG